MSIKIEKAVPSDYRLVYELTKELMAYHNALDIFTTDDLRFKELIESGFLNSFIAFYDGKPAGVMSFFFKLTTFTGRKILYIEDLYAKAELRGNGIGKALINKAKEIAAENDCEQIELKCADWNKTSAEFYGAVGMKNENEWITFTLDKTLF